MTKLEALEVIDEYESDFSSIEEILNDENLTPSQKCDAIAEIVVEPEEEEEDPEEDIALADGD